MIARHHLALYLVCGRSSITETAYSNVASPIGAFHKNHENPHECGRKMCSYTVVKH
jgi:hypothetical protein